MNKHVGRAFVWRVLMLAVAVLIAWGLLSVPALADMRIHTVEMALGFESPASDLLLKRPNVRVVNEDGSGQIYSCAADELIMLSPRESRLYWRGSSTDFQEQLQAMFAGALADLSPDAAAMWDEMELPDVEVRITELGSNTIAGYLAVEYLVEYNDGDEWHTLENVWVSEQLMNEIRAELGDCIGKLSEILSFADEALALFVTEAVVSATLHPEYKSLRETGFLMRTVSELNMFGFAFTLETIVREVSHEPLSDQWFAVPDGYTRVDDLGVLFGL